MFTRAANLLRELRAPASPLFSIIVPVLNGAAALERTVASVLGENGGADFEVVVMDGGSTDGTLDFLRAQPARVRWSSGRDAGVYDAMNKGVAQVRGRWLLFLGAGDRLRPGVLARVAPLLPRNTLALVYGNAFMHDKGVVWDGPWTPEKFRKRNICHQAIFYGRALFPLLGNFDTQFRILADYEMNMRCFAEKRVRKVFIDEVISDYEGGGMSGSVRDEAFYAARPALLQKYFGIATKKP
jgi:glycosyltransferase involved in cell wall biosynthesis